MNETSYRQNVTNVSVQHFECITQETHSIMITVWSFTQ